jgi:hypothetical protein
MGRSRSGSVLEVERRVAARQRDLPVVPLAQVSMYAAIACCAGVALP